MRDIVYIQLREEQVFLLL